MTASVNNSKPGIFGSYFTPQKSPLTWGQEVRKGALLASLFFGCFAASMHLNGKGLFNKLVLVPITENILFHGFFTKILDVSLNAIQGRPKTVAQEESRKTLRVNVIAMLFAYIHKNNFTAEQYWLPARAFGYLTEETGGYTLPIALHMLHNAAVQVDTRLGDIGIYPSIQSQFSPLELATSFPITCTIDALALWMLGKNINPLTSIKETYRYFTKKKAH